MTPVLSGWIMLFVSSLSFLLIMFASRVVEPQWWRRRALRVTVFAAFTVIATGALVWATGRLVGSIPVVRIGAAITYVAVLSTLPAALIMPVAAGVDRLLCFLDRHATRHRERAAAEATATANKLSRRSVIRLGTGSLPAAFALGGASGFAQARRDPTTPIIRLRYPDLHPDLEGLRILQLSDLHLGACLGLDDLKRGLETAQGQRPDLIVLTGDLADDVTLIPEALRLVAAANARLGAFSALGNHEYIHDIDLVRPLYEASPVPLLVGTGRSIRVGGATLYVGGADDPIHMKGDIARLVTASIEAAAAAAPPAPPYPDFRLLLCHRPEGFGPANECGFDLTLSGHTHGGQIGLFGRSLLERIRPDIGWWGAYAKKRPAAIAASRLRLGKADGPSRLYTTSGFGHWFPFRVGCPTEMPILVLEGARRTASATGRA